MTLKRALLLVGVFLCLWPVGPLHSQSVDPRYVGHWRLAWSDASGPWSIDFTVSADGTYTSRTVGPGTDAADRGSFEASGGRMAWKSASTPAKDAGVYHFDEGGNLIATGSSGVTARWTRPTTGTPPGTGGATTPPSESRPSMIDPAVVGTWTREITAKGKTYTMYMRLDADGQYRSWAEGAHQMNGESGLVVTQDGVINVGRAGGGGLLMARYRVENGTLILEKPAEAVKDSLKYRVPQSVWRRAPDGVRPPSEKSAPATLSEADAKDPEKCFALGEKLYEGKELKAAFEWFQRAAELGHVDGQVQAGWHLANGMGIRQDLPAAVGWYRRAMEQGSAKATGNLGSMYELGTGVREDWVEAARLWRIAAEKGLASGEASMGRAYQFGIGVPQNRALAIEWSKRAGAHGNKEAAYYADYLKSRTNNIGFRNAEEKNLVVGGQMRSSAELWGADPAGILFHDSAERLVWLRGLRQRVDQDETATRAAIAEQDRKYQQDKKDQQERDDARQRNRDLGGR